MRVAIAGQKGGTGKSTIAVGIAAELYARGDNVLLVDADPQATARTWGDVAAEAAISTPTIIAMGSTMHHQGQLPQLSAKYAHTIIDCPGRDGRIQRSALLVADIALLPCGPSAADAWAMAESVEVVREAQTVNPNLRPAIVITRKTRTTIGKSAREMLESLGLPVLRSELCFRVAYQEFLASGKGLTAYAAGDPAAIEVCGLVDEIIALMVCDGLDQTQGEIRHAS